jgi:acyl-CoA thioester hydrolase
MPLTHTRSFRVRFYECDANGHLNSANYLRYMQETAFDASAAAGYGMERYNAMGHFWLIRESQVEYLRPLRYDDRVDVTTWIADFRRVTSRRAYEFHRGGELVARAFTDWVFIDAQTSMPSAIPAQLALDFFPEGVPASFPPRQPFPKAPPSPPGAFSVRRSVVWQDIDGMQHVNNAVYMNYASEAGFQAAASFGWPWTRMAEHGFTIFIRRARVLYLQPALPGDELEITTWISGLRRSLANRHYEIRRIADGALLSQVYTLSVWVSLETGLPVRIPQQFLDDFQGHIAA